MTNITSNKPKLSIIVLAYNVEKYICQALDSILAQKVNFEYEIIIGNDGSNDGTANILLEYKEKYPDLITLNLTKRTKRKGPGDYINFANNFLKIRGKYFAVLDGDDFWTDERKLQKQIDFLDANSDFTVCGHNYWYLFEDGKMEKAHHESLNQHYTFVCNGLEDLLVGGFCPYMQTSSLVYRNVFSDNLEIKNKFFHPLFRGDFIRTLLHGEKGKSKYLNEVMSVYRIVGNGDWSQLGTDDRIRKHIDFFLYHKRRSFDKKYARIFDNLILRHCKLLMPPATMFLKKVKNIKYYLMMKLLILARKARH